MNSSSPARTPGLTLIEVAVVVVVMGIVSTVTLPHLSHFERDARIDKLTQARGAVAASAAIIHSVIASGQDSKTVGCAAPGAVLGTITPEGAGQVCTDRGHVEIARFYPSATEPGIVAAAALAGADYQLTRSPGAVTIELKGAPDPAHCAFRYTEPLRPGAPPELARADTSGC